MSWRRRLYLYTFFSILLVANVLFFVIIRSEFPEVYVNFFGQVAAWSRNMGLSLQSEQVQAIVVLTGFMVASVSSASLFFLTLGMFRAQKPTNPT